PFIVFLSVLLHFDRMDNFIQPRFEPIYYFYLYLKKAVIQISLYNSLFLNFKRIRQNELSATFVSK
ncbi:hypothetical protein, partial [Anaerotruncus colihominis]|uniref:hypothetical protein n=1 Tax=Anaerotruncus colihominis TaxID=169435 RepID=UPI002943A42B